MVNPYGIAGAACDPETVEGNYQTHPVATVRAANVDDLEGMVREPNIMPDADEAIGIASTDDMELKVLKPTMVTVGDGTQSLTFAAHATFMTVAEPKPPASSRAAALALQEASDMCGCIASAYRRRHVPGGPSPNGVRRPSHTARAHGKSNNGFAREPQASRQHADARAGSGRASGPAAELPPRRSAVQYALPAGGALGHSWHYRLAQAEEVFPDAWHPGRASAQTVHGR